MILTHDTVKIEQITRKQQKILPFEAIIINFKHVTYKRKWRTGAVSEYKAIDCSWQNKATHHVETWLNGVVSVEVIINLMASNTPKPFNTRVIKKVPSS